MPSRKKLDVFKKQGNDIVRVNEDKKPSNSNIFKYEAISKNDDKNKYNKKPEKVPTKIAPSKPKHDNLPDYQFDYLDEDDLMRRLQEEEDMKYARELEEE